MAINKILVALCLIFSGVANAEIIKHFNSFNVVQADARYVNITGDTMTGPLTLSGSSLTVSGGMTVDTASNALVVDSVNHRVGFGIASPTDIGHFYSPLSTLWVETAGTGGSAIKLKNTEGEVRINADANSFGLRASASGDDHVRLLNNGNFGIGTTAPATKLHVVGGVIVSTATNYGSGGATWEAGGGRGVYATNNSGAALSSGTVVQPVQSLTGLAITTSAANSEFPVGTIYDDSCADGALCRVCTEGICPARLITSADCAITNDVVYTGSEVGRASCAVISAGIVHNQELGNPATFSASNGDVIKIWAHRN